LAVLVRHAMTESPKTLSAERSAGDAAGLMSNHDVGSIPVVEGDTCIGIVTDRDLVLRVMSERRDPNAVTLGEILTKDVTTVSPDVELHEARDIMERHKVRRLLVVKDRKLVGILSLGDVAVALASKRIVGEALSGISESPSTLGLNEGPAIGTPRSAQRRNG
jgi:CBS domain-containing protein